MTEEKVTKYEEFLNDQLKKDLKTLLDQRDQIFQEIAEHLELQNTIHTLQKTGADAAHTPLKTKVDLGCNFYCSAIVDDPSRLFVKVGFGFFVEMTHAEALSYIARRVAALESRSEQLGRDAVSVRAKIDVVVEALKELQGIRPPEQSSRTAIDL